MRPCARPDRTRSAASGDACISNEVYAPGLREVMRPTSEPTKTQARPSFVGITPAAVGLVIIAVAPNWATAAVGAVIAGGGFTLLCPSLALIAIDRSPEQERGATLGAVSSFLDVAVASAGVIGGRRSASVGYAVLFVTSALAAISAIIPTRAAIATARRPGPARLVRSTGPRTWIRLVEVAMSDEQGRSGAWGQFVAQAWTDDRFKQRLLADPRRPRSRGSRRRLTSSSASSRTRPRPCTSSCRPGPPSAPTKIWIRSPAKRAAVLAHPQQPPAQQHGLLSRDLTAAVPNSAGRGAGHRQR